MHRWPETGRLAGRLRYLQQRLLALPSNVNMWQKVVRCAVSFLLVTLLSMSIKQSNVLRQHSDCHYMDNGGDKSSKLDTLDISDACQLIETLQQRTLDILRKLLGNVRKAALFDLADMENKGDPAINVGELNTLAKLNVSLLAYCNYRCSDDNVRQIHVQLEADDKNARNTVAVLSHGGGNFGGYAFNDYKRSFLLKEFTDYHFLLFSQSTWFRTEKHLKFVKSKYSQHKNMTAMLRDQSSFNFTKSHFPTIHAVLAPDMAFGIGQISRFFQPTLDVIWINREDGESPGSMSPSFPSGVSNLVTDWFYNWPSPRGKHLIDKTYMVTYNGFLFLQRGRVLVTDRLHGHILATLLDMPTVIIDNKIKKISNLRNTWTKGLSKVVMARNASDAVDKALQLLSKYGNSIPHVSPTVM